MKLTKFSVFLILSLLLINPIFCRTDPSGSISSSFPGNPTFSGVSVNGTVTADKFVGDGSMLTGIGGAPGVGDVSGTGNIGQVTFWDGLKTVTGNNTFIFDPANFRLGVSANLRVTGNIIFGENNSVGGIKSSILGGDGNLISNGFDNVIVGGTSNTISSLTALGRMTISGGQTNTIFNARNSTISGGSNNEIGNSLSVSIGGGNNNVVTTNSGTLTSSVIGGGLDNLIITSDIATIAGGNSNLILSESGNLGFIGGGQNNIVSGNSASIVGGNSNTASGAESAVGGGHGNIAFGGHSIVGGGFFNKVLGAESAVGGGANNTVSGVFSFIGGGTSNIASSNFSFIGGGDQNIASGNLSTIVGGFLNIATGNISFIGGGEQNTASNTYATVSGGLLNIASGIESFVGGGDRNIASGNNSTIGGGLSNIALSQSSTVGGGSSNQATGIESIVGGGFGNKTIGINSTIAGGISNIATADFSTIGGGDRNISNGFYATVGGGRENMAFSDESTIGGGRENTASINATVGGGFRNTAFGVNSTVGGGSNNSAGLQSVVGGGSFNIAGGTQNTGFRTIGGGSSNTASGNYTVIGGGEQNTASGQYSTVPGGSNNTAKGQFSFAAGRIAHALQNGVFVWSDSTPTPFMSGIADSFLINASGGVGINTATPNTGASLTVSGNIEPFEDDSYALGTSLKRFSELFVAASSIHIGTDGDEATITYDTGSDRVNLDKGLQVNSTTSAFIPPRMTTAQREAITPVNGMIIYDTDFNNLVFYDSNDALWLPSFSQNLDGAVTNVGGTSTKLALYAGGENIGTRFFRDSVAIAISAMTSEPLTAGTLDIEIVVNDVAQTGAGEFLQLTTSNPNGDAIFLSSPVSISSGDKIQFRTVTTGATPTGLDIQVSIKII
jgi:hypothetical protein